MSIVSPVTYTWNGPASGDFNNAKNWFPAGGPPGPGDTIDFRDVEIINSSGSTATVATIEVFAPLVGSGVSLLKGDFAVTDHLTLKTSTHLRFEGGSSFTFQGGHGTVASVGFALSNAIIFDQNTTLSIQGGGSVNVTGSISIDQAANPTIVQVDGPFSSLNVNGDWTTDGATFITNGAMAFAHDLTVSSIDTSATAFFGVGGGFTAVLFVHDLNVGGVLPTAGSPNPPGYGQLFIGENGAVFVQDTLTLTDDLSFDTDGHSSHLNFGRVFVDPTASLSIGSNVSTPGTLFIEDAGPSIGLIGRGMVDAPLVTNNGMLEATGGQLVLAHDLGGTGVSIIDHNSILEIGGQVSFDSTVKFLDDTGTLVLDDPGHFFGLLDNLHAGNQIELMDVNAGSLNATIIGAADPNLGLFSIFDGSGTVLSAFRTTGTNVGSLHVQVASDSTGHNTVLTVQEIGTTTVHHLNEDGLEIFDYIYGVGDGITNNTDIYKFGDTFVDAGSVKGLYHEHLFVDLRNGMLNSKEHVVEQESGEVAYIIHSYDNTGLTFSDAQKMLNPLTVDPASHDFWKGFVHGPLERLRINDGLGTIESLADLKFSGARLVSGDHPPFDDLFGPAAGASLNTSLGASSADSIDLTPTIRFGSGGLLETRIELVQYLNLPSAPLSYDVYQHNSDNTYSHLIIDFFKGDIYVNEVFSSAFVNNVILAPAKNSHPDQPTIRLVDGHLDLNLDAGIIGTHGVLVGAVTGTALPGRVLRTPEGLPLSQDTAAPVGAAGVISNDGSGLIGQDGAGLIGQDGAGLIGQDGAGLIGQDGGGLIGQDGAGLRLGLGGNLIGQDGAGFVPLGNATADIGSGPVLAGGGNILGMHGTVSPGSYLAGATIFADANLNGVLDNGETWAITDDNGQFSLIGGSGPLTVSGGINTATHLPFKGTLTSPLGSVDVSALTTVVNGLAQKIGTIDGAIDQVQDALGIDPSVDLTIIDPVAGTNNGDDLSAKVYVETVKAADTVALITAALVGRGGDGAAADAAIYAAMVNFIDQNGILDLSNEATDLALLNTIATTLEIDLGGLGAAIAHLVATTNQLIDEQFGLHGSGNTLVRNVTLIETAVQGDLAEALQEGGGDPASIGGPAGYSDLYITPTDTTLTVETFAGVLANDKFGTSANLSALPGHGSLTLNEDGSFSYTPNAGFVGTDSFTYTASNEFGDSAATDVDILVGNINALQTPEQQIGQLYVGYYNRAPDPGGLNFWIDNFVTPPAETNPFFHNLPKAADSFADPGQAETIALYPFLANPGAATYANVVDFVQDAYGNLFNRSTDPIGEGFWSTAVAKSLGIPVPHFDNPVIDGTAPLAASAALIAFIFGALGTDAQTVANKVVAGLYYKHALEDRGVAATSESAHAAFSSVTFDPATVLASEAVTNGFIQSVLHAAEAPLAALGLAEAAPLPSMAGW